MKTFKLVSALRSNRYFDDDTIAGGNGGDTIVSGSGADTLAGGGGGGGGNSKRVFNQDDVDRIVKDRLKKKEKEREDLVAQMESWRQQGLTPENVEQLNTRIEQLQNEGKTKEQLASEAQGKLEKKHKTEIEKLQGEGTKWKGKYEQYRSQTEIMTEAGKVKAHNSLQIYNILRPDTIIVEDVGEDGKPTGEYSPRVNFRDKDKDGKPVTLQLSVTDAIKRMTEMEEHMNLFDSGGSGGLGGRNNGRQNSGGSTAIPQETGAYMAARAKNKNLVREGAKA